METRKLKIGDYVEINFAGGDPRTYYGRIVDSTNFAMDNPFRWKVYVYAGRGITTSASEYELRALNDEEAMMIKLENQ